MKFFVVDIKKCSFNFIFDDIVSINFKNLKYIKNTKIAMLISHTSNNSVAILLRLLDDMRDI